MTGVRKIVGVACNKRLATGLSLLHRQIAECRAMPQVVEKNINRTMPSKPNGTGLLTAAKYCALFWVCYVLAVVLSPHRPGNRMVLFRCDLLGRSVRVLAIETAPIPYSETVLHSQLAEEASCIQHMMYTMPSELQVAIEPASHGSKPGADENSLVVCIEVRSYDVWWNRLWTRGEQCFAPYTREEFIQALEAEYDCKLEAPGAAKVESLTLGVGDE